jgi:hypothetical protein
MEQASNITFTRFVMVDSLYGGRFKSWSGGNGLVSDVHYSDFTLRNVTFPIFITQNYYDQAVGKPTDAGTSNTNIANFSYRNFAGEVLMLGARRFLSLWLTGLTLQVPSTRASRAMDHALATLAGMPWMVQTALSPSSSTLRRERVSRVASRFHALPFTSWT